MAGELQTDYLTGKVVYFLLRNSVGQVWNGATFENYTTANYATYPITGTEQGVASGYFTGNMPAVAAGIYYVVAKERVGGSPAESDISVGTGTIQWNGSNTLPLAYVASGASVFLASGAVSGQPISLLSGQQVQVWSGTFVNLFSGQNTLVYSGQLSGQPITLLSGTSWLASGNPVATLDKSGYALSSGGINAVTANALQRDLSGIQVGAAINSLGTAALKLTSRFNALSGTTFQTDGTTVKMTQSITHVSGFVPIGELGVGT